MISRIRLTTQCGRRWVAGCGRLSGENLGPQCRRHARLSIAGYALDAEFGWANARLKPIAEGFNFFNRFNEGAVSGSLTM